MRILGIFEPILRELRLFGRGPTRAAAPSMATIVFQLIHSLPGKRAQGRGAPDNAVFFLDTLLVPSVVEGAKQI